MTHKHATIKALFVTLLFAVFPVIGYFKFALSTPLEPGLIPLYVLLLVHTFLSVRCFSQLVDPKDMAQAVVDVCLVASYALLGLFIRDVMLFMFGWIMLFAFAALKYVLLLGKLRHPRLLRRKLIADIGGLLLMPLLFLLVFIQPVGHEDLLWPMVIVNAMFAFASIYYFFVRPLYVPDKMSPL